MSLFMKIMAFAAESESEMKVSMKPSQKTFLFRLVGCSTLGSLADTPENLSDIIQFIPDAKLANSTLSQLLRDYASQHKLTPFPLQKLHRLKANRNAQAATYTQEWLAQQGLPQAWLAFVDRLRSSNAAGEGRVRTQTRNVIDWAWFERHFEKPADIAPTDLRDPHHPERVDTFFHHIRSLNITKKWDYWNNAEHAFKCVYNTGHLAQEASPLLPTNPFQYHKNPFKSQRPQTTHRHRIPTNVHEAMLQVLLTPDENGNPTWSFVRNTLKWDWYNWKNPQTGREEHIWCPSRAHLMGILLLLPIRSKQGRWLDQGLMDQKVWDMETMQYLPNTHPLKEWRYPNDKTHLEVYGRPSGVFQPIQDNLYATEQLCIFINTNKTQMWDPERITGYEVWWPRGDELREQDIAKLTKQANYLDRPYDILEAQRQWMKKQDPNPVPVTFIDSSQDEASVNKDFLEHYPYSTPLFRDLSSPYHREDGTEYFLPVAKDKLTRLFSALAVHTEEKTTRAKSGLCTHSTQFRSNGCIQRA